MIDTGQEENWPCRFEIKSPPRFLGYARWSNTKGERNVDARGHVVVVVALESRGSPVELLDELENCSHPRSGNGRRYKSAAVPSPSLPPLLPPILKLNSHFSYDSLLSFEARGRERDNFDIRVVARETMARVSEERKAKLWRLPFCNPVCGSL